MTFPGPAVARRVFPVLALAALALAAIHAASAGEEVLVRARLVAEDGTPVAGDELSVYVVDEDGPRDECLFRTGPGGLVELREEVPVRLLFHGEHSGVAEVAVPGPDVTGSGVLDLGVVRLERKWVLRVAVRRGDDPAPSLVEAWWKGARGSLVYLSRHTGPGGVVDFVLPCPGKWRVDVEAVADEELAERRAFLGEHGNPDATTRVRVPEKLSRLPLEVLVRVPTGAIAGRILAEDGTPVSDALVLVHDGKRFHRDTKSLVDGTWVADSLPDRTWTLRVLRRGFVPFQREGIRVAGGATTRVDVRLVAAAPFRLVPRDRDGKPLRYAKVVPLGPGDSPPRWPRRWFQLGGEKAVLVDVLPPGRNVVAVWRGVLGIALVEVRLPVPPGATATFRWPETRAVRLAVVGDDGSPANGVHLAALRAERGPNLLPVLEATRHSLCCGPLFAENLSPGEIFLPPLPTGCYRARLELDGARWTVPFCLGPPGTPGARPTEHRVTCGDILPTTEISVVVGVPGQEPGPGPLPSPVRPAELVPPDAAKEPATRSR